MTASLTGQTVSEFTAALASGAAVPGGGAACALVGALGAALGAMVGAISAGKQEGADAMRLEVLTAQAQALRGELLELVEQDALAFEPLSRAYRIPRDDPSRPEILEACLHEACAVPLKILRAACQAIELQRGFAALGGKLVVSDAGTGAALCRAALQGAALNVYVNTRLMRNRSTANAANAEAQALTRQYAPLADQICADVAARLTSGR